jgi:hypothetical protein
MSKVMYKSDASYVFCRAGIYYYTRRVPYDVRQHYTSNRLSFSLRTKSNAGALRAAQSVTPSFLGAFPKVLSLFANKIDVFSEVIKDRLSEVVSLFVPNQEP